VRLLCYKFTFQNLLKMVYKYNFKCILPLILFVFFTLSINAQVTITPGDTSICNGQSVTLNATGTGGTGPITGINTNTCTSAGIQVNGLTDDNVQGPFPIGFDFCFYGNNYNQIWVGSNNWAGFSGGQTGTWVTTTIPNAGAGTPKNCIMSPWQDINPGVGGTVRRNLIGTAPNRKLTISWCNVPMFSCAGILYSSQIILYEGTNIIETHILDRQLCANWNNGNATHGLHNLAGNQATIVPGRNNTPWAANNDGKRFTPSGPGVGCGQTTAYTISDVPYNPIYGEPPIITWYLQPDLVNPIGTGPSITVSPTVSPAVYVASLGPINGGGAGAPPFDEATVNIDDQIISTSVVDIACFGGAGGGITASVPNFGPWTYVWADSNGIPVQQDVSINAPSVLNPPGGGIYFVQVTDNLGCVFNGTDTINEPLPLTLNLTQIDSMLCLGDNNAQFTVVASGGTPNYNFTSVPSALGFNGLFTPTVGGQYDVTVTDNNNCSTSLEVNVYQIPVPFNIIVDTVKQIRCFGDNSGEIIIIPVGGLPPYSFSCAQNPALNNTTGQFVNLVPGQYTITCTDSYGCSFLVDEVISQPNAPLSANLISQSPVICSGDSTGIITVQALGGTAPYDFANCCFNINTNPAFFTDVFAGSDIVQVVDANGCVVFVPYIMNQPAAPLTLDTLFFQNVLCLPSQDGTISLNVTGGWPINGLVYDYNLFQQQPDESYLNVLSNQTGVFGNLGQGAYYVVVTDELGCSDSLVYDITSPDFEVGGNIIVHTNNICFGGNSGRIFFQGTGGAPPYQYFVNGVPSNTNDLLNLTAGSYSITIVDQNGCQFNILETITEPPFYQLNITSIGEVDCFGNCTGTVQLNAIGGTPGYVYSIDGFTANNTGLFNNLCGGNFTATVTDSLGCVYSATSSVLEPAAPLDGLLLVNDPVTCFGGSDGEFYIQAIGGSPSYNYTILGQTTAITETNTFGVFLNLPADDYDVTITDSNNCIKLQTVTVAQPSNPMQLSVSGITDVKCFGDTTGRICFNLSGGTTPYYYSCSDDVLVQPEGNLGNNNTCYWGLNAGSYTILITDANGCTTNTQATITQPNAPLTASAIINPVSCFGGSNGSAAVSASGGTPVYTYAINTNQFAFNSTFVYNNLSAGNYQVIVRDQNLCTFSLPINMTQPNLPLASDVLNVVPLKCNGDTNACVTVAAIATTGSMPYTYTYNGVTNTTGLFCNFSAGNFSVVVTDANNCTVVQPVYVPAPVKVEAGFNYVRNVSCFGGNDGVLGAFGSGGTPGISPSYFYQWIGLTVQADSATDLSATTYCVVVKDSLGCVDTACATLTQPEKLITIGFGISDICVGDSTTLTVNATGGTPNYIFNWYPNGITQTPPLQGTPITVDPTASTYYLVDVTDSRNCKSEKDTFNVVVHPLPTAAFVVDKPIGCQGMCAQFRDISLISSTTDDVLTNWYWYYGDNTFESAFNPSHCYEEAGSFQVRMIVETNYGCKDTVIVPNAIFTYPNPIPEFSYGPQPTTLIDPEISFSPVLVEGNLYKWDFGDGANSNLINPVHLYGDTGTYCVTLTQTSINGCIDSTINCVRIDPDVTLYVPQAFTPNGDDVNDSFYAIGQYINEYSIEVFDRWGTAVFAGVNIGDKWDGKLNGVELSQGSYTWYIKAADAAGKKIRKTGTVTLIR
jgi:gliding motility-associated-like protein